MHLKWGRKASNVAGEIHLELSWLQLLAFCGFEPRLLCGLQGSGDNSAVGWIRYAGTCDIIRHDGKGASILSVLGAMLLGKWKKVLQGFLTLWVTCIYLSAVQRYRGEVSCDFQSVPQFGYAEISTELELSNKLSKTQRILFLPGSRWI